MIADSGVLNILPRVQRLRLPAEHGGRLAHVWVDEHSVHVLIGGEHVRTAASNLTSGDLEELRYAVPARRARPTPSRPAPAVSPPARSSN
ncbi:hypothetical protein ACIOK4_44040 [Streptomyces bottropensis]|uniref:hypothetical protein n=1 Tax=Streptomyces bottropensis TaxID=42235 RepID=UPI003800393E